MTAPLTRPPVESGLHVRYEKAGLILDALPVPWNADAVIIEANVKLPASAPRDKRQFTLKNLSGGPTVPAEIILQKKKNVPARVFFRIPVPDAATNIQVFWNAHALGETAVPIVTRAEFLQGLSLRLVNVHIGFKGGQSAPCRAYVSGQCQTLCVSAVIESATPLAPIADLDLNVVVERERTPPLLVPVVLTSGQLRTRQTQVTVFLPKPRRSGVCTISWQIGDIVLQKQQLSVISKRDFLRSLRITSARFLVEKNLGHVRVLPWLPQMDGRVRLDAGERIAPCFYVCSGTNGVAGLAELTLHAVFTDDTSRLLGRGELLVTDGPMPFLPVTLSAAELDRIKHFTLDSNGTPLGNLPLTPTPQAGFTAEGGFAPLDDFLWSPAAEEQLQDRLGKLLAEE